MFFYPHSGIAAALYVSVIDASVIVPCGLLSVADIDFYPGANKYYPVIYLNDYWNLNSDYMPINHTTK